MLNNLLPPFENFKPKPWAYRDNPRWGSPMEWVGTMACAATLGYVTALIVGWA